jgi:hypothetical protein
MARVVRTFGCDPRLGGSVDTGLLSVTAILSAIDHIQKHRLYRLLRQLHDEQVASALLQACSLAVRALEEKLGVLQVTRERPPAQVGFG